MLAGQVQEGNPVVSTVRPACCSRLRPTEAVITKDKQQDKFTDKLLLQTPPHLHVCQRHVYAC